MKEVAKIGSGIWFVRVCHVIKVSAEDVVGIVRDGKRGLPLFTDRIVKVDIGGVEFELVEPIAR